MDNRTSGNIAPEPLIMEIEFLLEKEWKEKAIVIYLQARWPEIQRKLVKFIKAGKQGTYR